MVCGTQCFVAVSFSFFFFSLQLQNPKGSMSPIFSFKLKDILESGRPENNTSGPGCSKAGQL